MVIWLLYALISFLSTKDEKTESIQLISKEWKFFYYLYSRGMLDTFII